MCHWCLSHEVSRKNTHRVPKRDAVGFLSSSQAAPASASLRWVALYLTYLAIHLVSHGLSRKICVQLTEKVATMRSSTSLSSILALS